MKCLTLGSPESNFYSITCFVSDIKNCSFVQCETYGGQRDPGDCRPRSTRQTWQKRHPHHGQGKMVTLLLAPPVERLPVTASPAGFRPLPDTPPWRKLTLAESSRLKANIREVKVFSHGERIDIPSELSTIKMYSNSSTLFGMKTNLPPVSIQ